MNEEQILQIPCELSKATTMAHRSLRIVFDSQENLSDEQMGKIMALHDKTGWLCFLPEERPIDALDVVSLPKLEWDKDEVSPAKRQQNALFVWWEQLKKPTPTFREFYERYMEKEIAAIKEKLV